MPSTNNNGQAAPLAPAPIVPHNYSSQPAADPPPPWVRNKIDQLWSEVTIFQHDNPGFNANLVAERLCKAETALGRQDELLAKRCLVDATYWMAQRERSAKVLNPSAWNVWLVIAVEMAYISAALLLMFVFGHLRPAAWFELPFAGQFLSRHLAGQPGLGDVVLHLITRGAATQADTLTAANTLYGAPVYALLWGFVGGATWCLDAASYWAFKRTFDVHFLPWYVVHPIVSGMLGGAVTLLLLAGFASIAQIGNGSYQETMTLRAVISVVSFSVGVSTHYIWRKLDRTLRKVLGESDKAQPAGNA